MDDSAGRSAELTWSGCRRCSRRQDCPYLGGGTTDGAPLRRCAAARLLDAEADRLLEAISRAEDAQALLRADEALERALDRALCAEMARIDALRAL